MIEDYKFNCLYCKTTCIKISLNSKADYNVYICSRCKKIDNVIFILDDANKLNDIWLENKVYAINISLKFEKTSIYNKMDLCFKHEILIINHVDNSFTPSNMALKVKKYLLLS